MHVFVGLGFCKDQGPFFAVDSCQDASRTRGQYFLDQKNIQLQLSSHNHCIGYYDLLQVKDYPCPENAAVSSASKTHQCPTCFQRTGFRPAFYNHDSDDLSVQQKQYNQRPHDVYLAAFDHGHVKVGIAYHNRLWARWAEQGARKASVIQQCSDAYEARSLEQSIQKNFKIPDRVTMSVKKRALRTYDPMTTQMQLLMTKRHVLKSLQRDDQRTEIVEMDPAYRLQALSAYFLEETQVSDRNPKIEGQFYGMIGSLLFIKTSDHDTLSMIDLQPYRGRLNVVLWG